MSDLIKLPNIGVVLETTFRELKTRKAKKIGSKELFVYDCKVTQMHVYICFMGWKEQ